MPAARMPEAHTLLTVSEETSFGMPPLIWAWRDGICPWPAWRTWPITTCWTSSGPTSARSSAALMAMPPSSVASREARPPPSLPMGVRAAPRMTVWGMGLGCPSRRGGRERRRLVPYARRPHARVFHNEFATRHRRRHAGHRRLRRRDRRARRQGLRAAAPGRLRRGADRVPARRRRPRRRPALADRRARRRGRSSRPRRRGSWRRRRSARANDVGTRRLCWELPHHVDDAVAGAFVEGTVLAAYRFDRYKKPPADVRARRGADRVGAPRRVRRRSTAAVVLAEAVNAARDLQNTPANDMTPTALADVARALDGRRRSRSAGATSSSSRAWARSPRSRRAPTRSRR